MKDGSQCDRAEPTPMTAYRRALEVDLSAAWDVFYQNEVRDDPNPPPRGEVAAYLHHVLRTGVVYVAERDDAIVAFAAAITRDNVAYLTDLFVRPDEQSSGIGQALLGHVMPADGRIHCTVSSTDPRALALYVRHGMRPRWPHVNLRLNGPFRSPLPASAVEVEVEVARPGDPDLVAWDVAVGGRSRPEDHAFWVREQRGTPLWFRRGGNVVGYGYVRLGAGSLQYPDSCTIGPVGVASSDDAVACVLAAVDYAGKNADVLRIHLPGPHRSLAPLLELGFHITYLETFVSSASGQFFYPTYYVTSGADLF